MPRPTPVPGLTARSPLSAAGSLLVRARLGDVRRYEKAFDAPGEPDGDAVHDMRVAARRLRAALTLFGRRPLAALEPEVKALQDALGGVRDLQVQRAWLAGLERAGPDADALRSRIGEQLPGAEKKLRQAIAAWRAAVARQVDEAAAGVRSGRLGGGAIRDAVREHLDRLGRRAGAVGRRWTPRRLHRLRIATKKLRYVLELVRPAFSGTDDVLATLVPLQEELGQVHDAHVRVDLLRRVGAGTRARGGAAAGSPLVSRVERESRPREEALRRELARWEEERVLREIRKVFR